MCEKRIAEAINIPLAQPGFDALGAAAPILMQVNPQGKWEQTAPDNIEEQKLQKLVTYLTESKVINAAQTYCTQCAAENRKKGGQDRYIPVLLLPPSLSAMDFKSEEETKEKKEKEEEKEKEKLGKDKKCTPPTEKGTGDGPKKAKRYLGTGAVIRKKKKEPYVFQRFTDFDLNSQW